MNPTFKTFSNRKDRALTSFSGNDNTALKRAICSNGTTGYVRQMQPGGPISVPNHVVEAVAAHLVKMGWDRA